MRHDYRYRSLSPGYDSRPLDDAYCSMYSLSDFIVAGSVGGFRRKVAGLSRGLTLAAGRSCLSSVAGSGFVISGCCFAS